MANQTTLFQTETDWRKLIRISHIDKASVVNLNDDGQALIVSFVLFMSFFLRTALTLNASVNNLFNKNNSLRLYANKQ